MIKNDEKSIHMMCF